MDNIKLEKNIPIPCQRYSKYPFNDMLVGDSFFSNSKSSSILTIANYFSKKHNKGWKFIVRKECDGTRIWRIK